MMKYLKYISLIIIFTVFLNCQDNNKNQNNIEIKIETKNGFSTAIITTNQKINGENIEKIKTIKGTKEEVIIKLKNLGYYIKEMDPKSTKKIKKLKIILSPKNEANTTGVITFIEENGVVNMSADVFGLSSGIHAIHIHEKADCSSDDGKSTGGHWNPTFENHGAWGSNEGFHRGDIGNFEVNSDGNGKIEFSTNLWCIGCEDNNNNIIGKAIIIHQGEDDFKSQPSGAAGARISCAGIIK